MTYQLLIDANPLQALQASGQPLMIFDCSYDLAQPEAGRAQYEGGHIPGAVYADLGHDLSDAGAPGPDGQHQPHPDAASGGRHPLPSRERWAQWLQRVGLNTGVQVVVYDRQGANFCGRLWWMLKWAGHEAVAVLDGGLQAWEAAGGALARGSEPVRAAGNFRLGPPLQRLVTTAQVHARLGGSEQTLVDARAAPRYRGEVEPLDPVAGHIPGALNRPFSQNLGPDGRFKSPEALRAEFDQLLEGRDPAGVVHQCGSGVSAVPNLLAMEIAGLGCAGLYAGSWSEWCRDPARPVARG